MTSLTNLTPSQTYGDLLTLGNDNTPGEGLMPAATLKNVQDGNGIDTPMQLATNAVNFNRTGGYSLQLDEVALTASATRLNSVTLDTPDLSFSTSALVLPTGTTAERQSAAIEGQLRCNSEDLTLEFSMGGVWLEIPYMSSDSVSRLVNVVSSLPDFSWSTSALKIPTGTTGEQPAGSIGEIRYDSTTNQFKGYTNLGWKTFTVS